MPSDDRRRRRLAAFGFLLWMAWIAVTLPLAGGPRPPTTPGSAPGAPSATPATTSSSESASFDASRLLREALRARKVQSEAAASKQESAAARTARLIRLASARGFEHPALARRLAARHSVEFRLVMAIIASESGGDPQAVSPAGAMGLMQLMPDTAAKLGVDPLDPEQNLEGAIRYLGSLLSSFRSVDLSLIAYNAGPGFAARYRAGKVELGAETRAFLMRVGKMLD